MVIFYSYDIVYQNSYDIVYQKASRICFFKVVWNQTPNSCIPKDTHGSGLHFQWNWNVGE